MRRLIMDLIPHAPQVGLYVHPNIPPDKLRNALKDFAHDVVESEVVALYDATLMGSAKDGAVFTSDELVFQNNDLEAAQIVRYADLVDVKSRRKLIGGRRVVVVVNRGRATFELEMDFSGKPDAAEYVTRFLKEAMLRGGDENDTDAAVRGTRSEITSAIGSSQSEQGTETPDTTRTDARAVRAALEELHASGVLARDDLQAMLEVLRRA